MGISIKAKIILLVMFLVLSSSFIVGLYIFNITKAQLSSSTLQPSVTKLQKETFLIIFTTFTFVLIIALVFAHTLIKPFDDLIIGTQLVASGRLDYKIKKRSSDEVGKLVDSFNEMIEKLSASNLQRTKFSHIAKREKNKAELIIDSMADGVIVTDSQYKIVLVNPAAQSMFSLNTKKFIGRHIMYFLEKYKMQSLGQDFPESEEPIVPRKKPIIKVREIEQKELKKAIRVTIGPLLDERRKAAGSVIVFEDITKAKEIDNMKTEFLSTVSHELRTPLTSITGYATLLADEKMGPLNEQQKRSLDIINKESVRLTNLINDILDLSKMELGKAKVKFEMLKLDEVAKSCPALILASKKGITVEFAVSKNLPKVSADRAKIMQVFTNLISNAVKFTPPGGKITIRIINKQDFVQTEIIDTGIGIARNNLPKLFTKFYQVESHLRRTQGGTGLGLAIVREIIALHHGLICVRSQVGKGTSISFALPKKEVCDADTDKCWEEKACKNIKCPAYQSKDTRCWLIMGTYKDGEEQFDKIELCKDCKIYQKRFLHDKKNDSDSRR
ncbi:MAG: ATP-binding protein [Candidatus Woesearchaeota archaeon]